MFRFALCLISCQAVLAFKPCALPATPPTVSYTPAALMENGHFRQADALLESMLEAQDADENAELSWLLSRAKAALGELELAHELAERALLADSSNSEYHVQLAAVEGRMAEKASLFKQLGFARRAKKELDIALALDPRNLDALYGLMLYYYAAPAFIGGDKNKAREMAETMTAINPARGYLAQARLEKDRKDPVREEEFYLKAIDADPDFYEAKAALSSFYLQAATPKFDAARTFACEALAIDPAGGQAWKNLAGIAAAGQCWTELDAILSEAAERNPFDLAPYYSAAAEMLREGRLLQTAEAYLRRYAARAPEANEPSFEEVKNDLKRLRSPRKAA
ncbi:MAG: hypothetical protein M3Z23_17775 [Acidobacteriota bacterium]|nr:hypothetical protein [Acidobacteriota bacterium]